MTAKTSKYAQIYEVVNQIPRGKVATYGQIAQIVEGCSARTVGYAMSSLPHHSDTPWQRVINSKGMVSLRSMGESIPEQQRILETEGVLFNAAGKVDLKKFGWSGPLGEWMIF